MAQTLLAELQAALTDLSGLRLEASASGPVKAAWMEGAARCVVAVKDMGGGLALTASICLEQHAQPRRVLIEAARLTGQCVALVEGRYLLRVVVAGPRREPAALRAAMVSLATVARDMTRAVADSKPPEEHVVFSHYNS